MDSYGFVGFQEWAEDKAVVKLAEKLKEEAGKSKVKNMLDGYQLFRQMKKDVFSNKQDVSAGSQAWDERSKRMTVPLGEAVGQAVSAHGETDLVLLALEALRRMALQERVVDVDWLMLLVDGSSKKFVFFFESFFWFVFERIICSNPHVGWQFTRQLHRLKGHQRTMPRADFVSAGARRSEGVFGGTAGG